MSSKILDSDLVIETQNGNERSFDILLNRHRAHTYHIALSICGNTPFVEDAIQEAFITAFVNLHQLRDPKAFLPWLKRIVINCCYQILRRERLHFPHEPIPEKMFLIENSMEDKLDKLAIRDSLYTALSNLPENHRLTLMLRYLSDYNSYKQIATITGVPVGTVRSRLNEGRKQLSARWNNEDGTDHQEFSNNSRWNDFYDKVFPGIYTDGNYLRKVLDHMNTDMKIIFTSGKMVYGRDIFEQSLYDDFDHGSCISNVNSCITSGNLSVINVSFENSPEHPNHCPPDSLLTILRSKEKLSSIRLFHSTREHLPVQSIYV